MYKHQKLHKENAQLKANRQSGLARDNNRLVVTQRESTINDMRVTRTPLQNGVITDNRTQLQSNNTGLPDNLKKGMESLSGMSLDHVKVHYNSPKPASVQAHAYAQGRDIHLASGQEKHLPHELGHVVQQIQGKVQPTTSVGGMAVNDNPGLEKEADLMGEKALQMKNAPLHENMLGQPHSNNQTRQYTSSSGATAQMAWPFDGPSIFSRLFGGGGKDKETKKEEPKNETTNESAGSASQIEDEKSLTEEPPKKEVQVKQPALRLNVVDGQVRSALNSANKALDTARKVDDKAANGKTYKDLQTELDKLKESFPKKQAVEKNIYEAFDSAKELSKATDAFELWFKNESTSKIGASVLTTKSRIEGLDSVFQFLGDKDKELVRASLGELQQVADAAEKQSFDKLETYNAVALRAIRDGEKVYYRFHTPNLKKSNDKLRKAKDEFGADWIKAIIESSDSIADAKNVLKYAMGGDHIAAFKALTGMFRGQLAVIAKDMAASGRVVASLRHFSMSKIPDSDYIELPIKKGYDLSAGRRQCSFKWAHFLDAHTFEYANREVLRGRVNDTSFWPVGTTQNTIKLALATAITTGFNQDTIYETLKSEGDMGFRQAFPVAGGVNTTIGIEIKKGFLSITQFYPRGGAGVVSFDVAEVNDIGRLLAFRK